MSAARYPPDDPREWLNRARSNLRLAAVGAPEVYREELCYNAQQAAEKAIKAVFVALGKPFPFTHNLAQLLELLIEAGVEAPAEVLAAKHLTRFAL
ncbi:MAG: HEPN domain-containing protein [Acidobacteria bacterium]|nr:HEPN domain-containing protein [Acidobacteriota bacterium]